MDKVETVAVRVQAIVEAAVGAIVPPTETEAQLIVPAPVIVAEVAIVALFWRVITVVTVRTTPTLTVSVAAEEPALLKATDLMVLFTVTVIESPARMMTLSLIAGTAPPGQGAFTVTEFQLPLPAVVIVAAKPVDAPRKVASRTSNVNPLPHLTGLEK
jgi:hypothetical protein